MSLQHRASRKSSMMKLAGVNAFRSKVNFPAETGIGAPAFWPRKSIGWALTAGKSGGSSTVSWPETPD